jgi:hypothetical protein
MKHKHYDGFAHVVLILVFVAVLGIIGFIGYDILFKSKNKIDTSAKNSSGNSSMKNEGSGDKDAITETYPDTDKAPELKLFWGADKSVGIPKAEVTTVGQFGTWEGGGPNTAFKEGKEPASEIEVRLMYKDYPLYAYTSGIITFAQDETVVIRYGKNYALHYKHVITIDKSLKVGKKVAAGDNIGTISPGKGKGAFWEIETERKDSKGVWAVNPVPFFDDSSEASLNALLPTGNFTSWVVDAADKEAGWVAYVGKPEICGDGFKSGWGKIGAESCYKDIGLGWTLN